MRWRHDWKILHRWRSWRRELRWWRNNPKAGSGRARRGHRDA